MVGGPRDDDARVRPGGDEHRLLARPEVRDQGAGGSADEVEARALRLPCLHARRHVEHEDERRARRRRTALLHVGPEVAAGEGDQEEELEHEEQVGTEALPLHPARGDALPEEEASHRDRAAAAIEEVECNQDGDGGEGQGPGGVREADAAHRRLTSPRRARSVVTNSATRRSVVRWA